ncbi:hypothetical protein N7466_011111 [Penicillium verhagenii]|uniref:uncharacterized protein n=1 Tax=Penicillium verhagenii TaxID=1562060 RepID=UPI0025458572|nr:uncharacterized protein N7466_011111 [Penicillium verhagenii]KAJ5917557.1 hypothetical protein N7466_011111 [Penicillium verhagenii]
MAAWLDLAVEATGWTLADTGRLESLVDSMGHPKSQYPSLVYFVGNSSRAKALRALFPYNNITRKGPASFIKLHLSTETANYKHPVLFAESSFLGDSTLAEKGFCQWPTEKLQHYPIQSNLSSTKDIKQHILSNFVLPWTHTLCFLLNKAGDIMKVRQLLERPRRNVKVGTQIIPNFLQVIIVLEKRLDGHDEALKELILWSGEQMTLNITLLDLRERHMLSPKAAFEPLRRLLLSHLSLAQSKRFENDNCDYENEDISAFIASAFLMNAYPPDMHHNFTKSD